MTSESEWTPTMEFRWLNSPPNKIGSAAGIPVNFGHQRILQQKWIQTLTFTDPGIGAITENHEWRTIPVVEEI